MARFFVIAFTTEDGIATKHNTIADAKRVANQRTGRGGSWQNTTLDEHATVWEKGATDDRDLFALVFSAAGHTVDAVVDAFGVDRDTIETAMRGPVEE